MPLTPVRVARTIALVGLTFLATSPAASAAPGRLDPSFGTAGVLAVDGGFAADAVFVQPSQAIVAVGQSVKNGDIVAERILPSGKLDASFGTGGVTRIAGAHFGGAAMTPDGQLLLTGNGDGNGTNGVAPFVTRLTAGGTLDASFGTAGTRKFTNPDGSMAYFQNVAVEPGGRIVVTGTAYASEPPNRLAIARLTAGGAVDTTFEQGGIRTMDLGPHGDEPWITAVQPDGKLLVDGTDSETFSVSRFLENGSPDPSFSADGIASVDFGEAYEHVRSLTVAAGGAITATGDYYDYDNDPSAKTLAVARFAADGSLDQTFGTAGSELLAIDSDGHNRAVAADAAGRLLVLGQTYGGDLRVTRLLPGGAIDTTYANAGVLAITDHSGDGGALQADGALVVGGQTRQGVSVFRLTGGGDLPAGPTPTPAPSPGGGGSTPTPTPTSAPAATPTAKPQSTGVATPTTKPTPTATPAVRTPPAVMRAAPAFVVPSRTTRAVLAKGLLLRLTGVAPSSGVVIVATAGKKRIARLAAKADATGTVRVRLKVSKRALKAARSKTIVLSYRYQDSAGMIKTAAAKITAK